MLSTHSESRLVVHGATSLRQDREQAIDARRLWLAVLAGRTRVFAGICTRLEYRLGLEQSAVGAPLPAEWAPLIERLLLGDDPKVLAFEHQCSRSSFALRATRALMWMGIRCSPRAVPAGLLLLANAARGQLPGPFEATIVPIHGKPRLSLLSIRRPDVNLVAELSPAERAIVELLVEARTHRQMAALRSTSARTIANQIANIYRKLGLTGRIPLVIRLAQRDIAARQAQPSPITELQC